jgi:hypothetical protein
MKNATKIKKGRDKVKKRMEVTGKWKQRRRGRRKEIKEKRYGCRCVSVA